MKLIELIHTLEDRLADMGDVEVMFDNGTAEFQRVAYVWNCNDVEGHEPVAVIAGG